MVTREQDVNRGGIERFLDGAGSFQWGGQLSGKGKKKK